MSILDTVGHVHDVQAMQQAADIKASEDVGIYGLLREKKYIKDKHLRKPRHQRLLPFTEPYQVAAHKLDLPWTRTNKAVMVQTAKCNLDCGYCFIGEDVATRTTVEELREDYWTYCRMAEKPSPIFRVSGGEPFLQQRFVADLVHVMARHSQLLSEYVRVDSVYVWLNTNLTIEPSDRLLNSVDDDRVGVIGSWKPVAAPEKFGTQLQVASQLLDAGADLYFYYPCALDEEDKELLEDGVWDSQWTNIALRWSAEFLSHLHTATKTLGDYYAARLQPTVIKYHYETVGGSRLFSTASGIKRDFMVSLLEKFIHYKLGEEYWWCPDYQVDVREGVV